MKRATVYSAAIVRHAIANFNKEEVMDQELYDKLGVKRERPNPLANENDACKKCGTALLGALSGLPLPAEESTESNGGHTFIVTPYCPNCK